MDILRTVPTNLSLAALQAELNALEANLHVDGQSVEVRLVSIVKDQVRTPESQLVPVDVNLVTFQPADGDGVGPIQLVDGVPPAENSDDREAFFDSLEQSPLTFVCFSDLLILGQTEEVVTCRALADTVPAVTPPTPQPATPVSTSPAVPAQPPVPAAPPTQVPSPVPSPAAPSSPAAAGKVLSGNGKWPFTAQIVGDDIVVHDILITCFGGNGDGSNSDPQDSGDTASGVNTNRNPVRGVSIAMDGRQFASLSRGEHLALDGAPIPRLRTNGRTAWRTPVEVTIGGTTHTPEDGLVDLGPGLGASKPGEPHALDLTPASVGVFAPNIPLHKRSTTFSARGSFRIIGGAKLI